jgi:hypothetical protein
MNRAQTQDLLLRGKPDEINRMVGASQHIRLRQPALSRDRASIVTHATKVFA